MADLQAHEREELKGRLRLAARRQNVRPSECKPVMTEAAAAIEALERENAELRPKRVAAIQGTPLYAMAERALAAEAQLSTAQALIREAVEVLGPFAKMVTDYEEDPDFEDIPGGSPIDKNNDLIVDDIRRAAALLPKLQEQLS